VAEPVPPRDDYAPGQDDEHAGADLSGFKQPFAIAICDAVSERLIRSTS
jgi:hypothetical protein